jgi:hypothetical protein
MGQCQWIYSTYSTKSTDTQVLPAQTVQPFFSSYGVHELEGRYMPKDSQEPDPSLRELTRLEITRGYSKHVTPSGNGSQFYQSQFSSRPE